MSTLALTSNTLAVTPAAGAIEYNGQYYGTDSNSSRAQFERLVLSTAQNTTSGTNIDFTSIPAWVKKITILLNGVSTNGTSNLLIQLGTSSGIENTGYTGSSSRVGGSTVSTSASSTAGATIVNSLLAADAQVGTVQITNINSNNWIVTCIIGNTNSGNTQTNFCGVIKSTASTLTQVRLTTVNGTDTFDAGSVNILYEG